MQWSQQSGTEPSAPENIINWPFLSSVFWGSSSWAVNVQLCLNPVGSQTGCVCFHSNWRTAWTNLERSGFSTQAMERFMDLRWVIWQRWQCRSPIQQAGHHSFLHRSTFRSRMPLAGTISAPRFSWISSCPSASTSPLSGKCSLAFYSTSKTPTLKTGRILKSYSNLPPIFWQARWRWQEPTGDHPQGYPGISGEDDRHSDRELRREMVGGQWRHQKVAALLLCSPFYNAGILFQAALALPVSSHDRTRRTHLRGVRSEGNQPGRLSRVEKKNGFSSLIKISTYVVVVCNRPVSPPWLWQVRQDFHSSGFMTDVDLDPGCTLNKKIRNAQLAQYNFILGQY